MNILVQKVKGTYWVLVALTSSILIDKISKCYLAVEGINPLRNGASARLPKSCLTIKQ